MKKGFTMIELIFVIVILGILASVAIPKLAATRDDAEISRAAANIRTLVTDLGAYYTAKGYFNEGTKTTAATLSADDLKKISAVASPVKVKNKDCFTLGNADSKEGTVAFTAGADDICKTLYKLPGMQQIVSSAGGTIGADGAVSGTPKLTFGGSSVKF